MSTAKELLEQALQLPEDERAAMARQLLGSLPIHQDEEVAKAWADELASRVNDVEERRVETVSWSDMRKRMLKREEDAAT